MYLQRFILAACIAGACVPANAALLFDNGGPNHLGGSDTVLSLEADDFVLSTQATLTSAQFWDFETPGGGDYAGSIFYSLYTNAANNPGALILSGSASGANVTRVATGISDPSGQFTEYRDTFNLAGNPALAAGTYWLALHNGPLSPINANSLANFAWESSAATCTESAFNVCGRAKDLTAAGSSFLTTSSENAFNITGTPNGIPEPGSLTLVPIGIFGLAFFTRRSRNLFGNLGAN